MTGVRMIGAVTIGADTTWRMIGADTTTRGIVTPWFMRLELTEYDGSTMGEATQRKKYIIFICLHGYLMAEISEVLLG